MTQEQGKNILEQHLKGINLTILWSLIVCTALSVGTVLSVYYGFRNEMDVFKEITNNKIDKTNMRIDYMEREIEKSK